METFNDNNLAAKGTRVDAGTAELWHIHKDHIKYGSNNATRVDFSGRNLQKIMEKIAEKQDLYNNLQKTPEQALTYSQCITWINKNC